jgi:hypothetical protein
MITVTIPNDNPIIGIPTNQISSKYLTSLANFSTSLCSFIPNFTTKEGDCNV